MPAEQLHDTGDILSEFPGFCIRKAVPDDGDAIGYIHAQAWRESYAGIIDPAFLAAIDDRERARRCRERIDDPGASGTYYIAEYEDGALGFGVCGPQRANDIETTGEVYALYFLEQAKGTGAAQELFKALARHLYADGMDTMSVWVLRDNLRARRFYEKMGGAHGKNMTIHIGAQDLIECAYIWPAPAMAMLLV